MVNSRQLKMNYKKNQYFKNIFIFIYFFFLNSPINLRCFVKFAPHLWSKKMHFNRSPLNFTNWFSTTWSIFPQNLNEFPRFLSILFWHLMILISYTRRLWAVATGLEVLLLYISKYKRTIPSIFLPHIPLTLLIDVLVFLSK